MLLIIYRQRSRRRVANATGSSEQGCCAQGLWRFFDPAQHKANNGWGGGGKLHYNLSKLLPAGPKKVTCFEFRSVFVFFTTRVHRTPLLVLFFVPRVPGACVCHPIVPTPPFPSTYLFCCGVCGRKQRRVPIGQRPRSRPGGTHGGGKSDL